MNTICLHVHDFMFCFFFCCRTSQQKTLSLHLFNVVAVVDRVIPTQTGHAGNDVEPDLDKEKFLPSVEEQQILMDELVFIFATFIIINIPQMKKEFYKVYPKHKTHDYSAQAGIFFNNRCRL